MLEEVPTEELQPAEAAAQQEEAEAGPEQQINKTDTWDDQDYEYFFGDYLDDGYRPRAPQEVKELPPIENTLSTVELALRPPAVAALDADRRPAAARNRRRRSSATSTTTGIWSRRSTSWRRWGRGRSPTSSARSGWFRASIRSASPRATCRSACCCSCGTSGSKGTPTEKVVTEHLRLLQNHQVPEIARKLGHDDRRSEGAHRDHPAPRSEAGQPLQPDAVAVRHPRRLRHEGRGRVRRAC